MSARSSHLLLCKSSVAGAALIAALTLQADRAAAQSFTVAPGATDTVPKTLSGTQTGTVASGGTLAASGANITINWNNTSTGVIITNNGLIDQTGTGRAIDSSGAALTPRSFSLVNNVGATLRAAANDTFRINTVITGGTVTVDNAGLIQAGGTGLAGLGQALDFRAIAATSGVTQTITNRATGVIEALTDDAVRPGQGATVQNFGIIRSFGANTSGGAAGTSDAIDAGARTGITITNETTGLISGARHGITADTDITVVNRGQITGRNGSGVGSDGNGSVTNFGTITGAYAGVGNIFNSSGVALPNGDGDGVDIDFIGTVRNFGVIRGTGAGGVDSGGRTNGSDGIAIGGGLIENSAGALISGATRGILVDDGGSASAFGAITITNAGRIEGLAASALTIVGNFNNTVTNTGEISGAGSEPAVFFNGTGANRLTTSGVITATGTGPAIRFGSGANQLIVQGGSIRGAVIGGGASTLSFALPAGTTFTVADAYTGFASATVQSGNVVVNGALTTSGATTIAPGASLSGSGALSGLVVNGTLAPGNSVGVLTVNGSLALGAGSTTAIEVQGATIDRVVVSGAATLGGTVRVTFLGGPYSFATPYTFLTAAGGRTGTFAGLDASGSGFGVGVVPTLGYTATDATLTLAPGQFSTLGLNRNQASVATALNRAAAAGRNMSPYFPLYNALAADLPGNLGQLTAQTQNAAGRLASDAAGQFLGVLGEARARQGSSPQAAGTIGISPWAAGFGQIVTYRGDGADGSVRNNVSLLGFAAGLEARVLPDVAIGAALGGTTGTARLPSGLGEGKADSFHAGLYGNGRFGALELSAAAAYARSNLRTRRQVAFAGAGDISGSGQANGFSGRFEASWRMTGPGRPDFAWIPFAAIQVQSVDLPRMIERTGVAALAPFALTTDPRSMLTSRTELGLRLEAQPVTDLTVFARAAWAAYLSRDASVTAGFSSLPGVTFVTRGSRPDQHSALLSAGIDWRLTPAATLSAKVGGELASRTSSFNASARLDMRF